MSSPPVLVWASWPSTDTPSQGASTRGVVFRPRAALQIWNLGRDSCRFQAMAIGSEVIFNEVNLRLDNRELVAEVAQTVVESAVSLQFGGRFPMVEVGDGSAECVESGGRAVEKGVEPAWEWFGGAGG
jgi:hypothetical protein